MSKMLSIQTVSSGAKLQLKIGRIMEILTPKEQPPWVWLSIFQARTLGFWIKNYTLR